MWVVGINRPYYPSMRFFQNKNEAVAEYNLLKEDHEEGGSYNAKVFIAKIEDIKEILTHY